MPASSSAGMAGRNLAISSRPAWQNRNPVCDSRALPPISASGAFSSSSTRVAPASRAAMAASNAALPPPATTTSYPSVTGGGPGPRSVDGGSPLLEAALDATDGLAHEDAEQAQQDDTQHHPVGAERGAREVDVEADARVRREELRDHDPDEGPRGTQAHPGQDVGHARGQ